MRFSSAGEMPTPWSRTRTASRCSGVSSSTHADLRRRRRVLDGVVDQVPDRRLQLLGSPSTTDRAGSSRSFVAQRLVVQPEARPRQLHALARPSPPRLIRVRALAPPRPRADAAGAQHLLDRVQQPVAVLEHDPVELAPLGLVELAGLERLQVEPDRRHRRLQLVGDGVDEGVVLLVAADLAHQEDGVEHDARR